MVRVRFAPSPTGYLHIGGARTAIYNWLFAKQNKGKFILRIEDTDIERHVEESLSSILQSLKWLGLHWDEGPEVGGQFGPYYQSQRTEIYKKYASILLENRNAYRCFCMPQELEAMREEQKTKGATQGYDGRCLTLSSAEVSHRVNGGIPFTIRLKCGAGKLVVDDLIHGKITFTKESYSDFIILRSDGSPTYNFTAAIDDWSMQITHVIRGDDHLSNTPKQIMIYYALDATPPQFGHIPMILGSDGKRLSKRHGATSVESYQQDGYLAEAMLNYLSLLGWSYDDKTTFFSKDELIEKFSLAKVSRNPAISDLVKLDWMNGAYIRQKSDVELADLILPFIELRIGTNLNNDQKNILLKVIPLIKERIKKLSEVISIADFYFTRNFEITHDAKLKFLDAPETSAILPKAAEVLSKIKEFNSDEIEKALRSAFEASGIPPKKLFQTIRAAITGKTVSPPLFESMEILGKEECIFRLSKS
ncbi:MAG: glutamate--tRNA ligase [Actinobacteria bacterium]|nr:glutamate--tRNA ligase [Actinomycetota bacterium]